MLSIHIQQATDHPLVLSAMTRRLTFEELNAAFGQSNRHFHSLVAKGARRGLPG